jgi:hypothetical protein
MIAIFALHKCKMFSPVELKCRALRFRTNEIVFFGPPGQSDQRLSFRRIGGKSGACHGVNEMKTWDAMGVSTHITDVSSNLGP